jgi:hypothetical protein
MHRITFKTLHNERHTHGYVPQHEYSAVGGVLQGLGAECHGEGLATLAGEYTSIGDIMGVRRGGVGRRERDKGRVRAGVREGRYVRERGERGNWREY